MQYNGSNQMENKDSNQDMKNEWIGCLFKVTRHAISMDGTVGQRN
jgi:hypothetical protein